MRIPKLRKHSSGQGRVTIGGQTHYLGKHGTQECRAKYNRLVGEFIATGGAVVRDDAKSDLTISEMLLVDLKWATKHYGHDSGELDRIKRITDGHQTSCVIRSERMCDAPKESKPPVYYWVIQTHR